MRLLLVLLLAFLIPITATAQQESKRPLDHADAARWNEIAEPQISPAGTWVCWRETRADGSENVLRVAAVNRTRSFEIPEGKSARFDLGERFLTCLVPPSRDALRAWKKKQKDKKNSPRSTAKDKNEKAKESKPRARLARLDLRTGRLTYVDHVASWSAPKENPGVAAWFLEDGKKQKKAADEARDDGPGRTLHVWDLARNFRTEFADVRTYVWSEKGNRLAFSRVGKDPSHDGVWIHDLRSGRTVALQKGQARVRKLSFDRAGNQLAWLSDRDDRDSKTPAFSLYLHTRGQDEVLQVAAPAAQGITAGLAPSPFRKPEFSDNGRRLFFGLAPIPSEDPDETPDDEKFALDLWSWHEDLIQPMQLKRRKDERQRSHLSVVDLSMPDPRIIQIGDDSLRSVSLDEKKEARFALGWNVLPYRWQTSHDTQVPGDVWRIDLRNGEKEQLLEKHQGRFTLSPQGRFATAWNGRRKTWMAIDVESGDSFDLAQGISASLHDERHDAPSLPPPHGGRSGLVWLQGDEGVIICDRYDLWLVDPSKPQTARCLTQGSGRSKKRRYRVLALDPETRAVDTKTLLPLAIFDEASKQAGFATLDLSKPELPVQRICEAARFGSPKRTWFATSGRMLFTRESYVDFPDLVVAQPDFTSYVRVSDANPQQKEFSWGSVELHKWRTEDGQEFEGLLYKPESFDPTRRYPTLTYFYERNSDSLHQHQPPNPHRSTIRRSFYVSRGYLVFVPDIHYRIGYPGASAERAVISGVQSLVDAGLADPKRLGLQGHSWGGYQIAHLVTRTDIFQAAIAGAPVANMTSAYGGIRWGSGMSRQFQYEKTQSRLGKTLWEDRERYLENSPVFFADRVTTPLLILHNDQDGAVPWYQGIELFMALRRCSKKVWMLNYNGQPHWVTTWATKRDYARRMQEFLDHFLLDAAAPSWMTEGIPATKRIE